MKSSTFIPLTIPDINDEDIQAVIDVLRSGMLVQGANVQKLEDNISEYLNVKHAVAVSSGTATLHVALIALGIGQGDEIIVPAFSYPATANVVELVGAKPVFVDIDLQTYNIDVNAIEPLISKRTKAIMPVHEFGLACNISDICDIASSHNLFVIEDAACALGAKEHGKFVGSFGDVGSFSFHPRKAITSGEGGILVTDDDDLAKKFRILRNHGIDIEDGKTDFIEAGFNYRMTDFQAAFVLSQFPRLADIISKKQILADEYCSQLKSNSILDLPIVPFGRIHSWQSFHVLFKNERSKYQAKLIAEGVGCNYGANCIPGLKYYREKYNLACESLFPNSLMAYQNGLVLPLYPQMSIPDVKRISDILNDGV